MFSQESMWICFQWIVICGHDISLLSFQWKIWRKINQLNETGLVWQMTRPSKSPIILFRKIGCSTSNIYVVHFLFCDSKQNPILLFGRMYSRRCGLFCLSLNHFTSFKRRIVILFIYIERKILIDFKFNKRIQFILFNIYWPG